jgi:hypothetical protein
VRGRTRSKGVVGGVLEGVAKVRASALCAPSRCTAVTCDIISSARTAALCGRARVVALGCHRPGSRASAAGVTWTCRTASAGWAERWFHTSVVDAAGAIYVIGGWNGGTFYADVWASTDGGARPDSVKGGGRGVLKGY